MGFLRDKPLAKRPPSPFFVVSNFYMPPPLIRKGRGHNSPQAAQQNTADCEQRERADCVDHRVLRLPRQISLLSWSRSWVRRGRPARLRSVSTNGGGGPPPCAIQDRAARAPSKRLSGPPVTVPGAGAFGGFRISYDSRCRSYTSLGFSSSRTPHTLRLLDLRFTSIQTGQ